MVFGPKKHDTNSLRIRKKRLSFDWRSLRHKKLLTKRNVLIGAPSLAVLLAFGWVYVYFFASGASYELSEQAETLLPIPQDSLAMAVKDQLTSYEYSKEYQPSVLKDGLVSAPRFSASFSRNPSDGIKVTDPVAFIDLTLKPKFGINSPRKDQNRIIYPHSQNDIQSVYTLQPGQMKEDIILNSYQGDKLTFDYELDLPDGVEARMEPNGSVGIYSVDPTLLGDITAGSTKDQELLDKARQNGDKTMLVYTIPAPFIKEYQKNATKAHTWLSLDGNTLTLHAEGLKKANYPVSIDPSVYIDTAARLMQGNNESNIDFDVDNELIQKGKTTGGRFDAWTSTLALPAARWNHQTAVYGGYIYVVGGNSGSSSQTTVYWAKINNSTGAIEAPNPGDGACASWCTSSNYDLPSSRQGAAIVIYSGYMYIMGGINGAGTRQDTVYIAKIGANGEPQLWHPTDSSKANWTYWYSDTALSSARSLSRAVAYNNTMYIVGGTTAGTTTGIATVERANITPNGVLTNWTAETGLGTGNERYGMGVHVYNDYLYVIGGAKSTTTQTTIYYNKINSDGTLNSWQTNATPLDTARAGLGGSFSTIWGGYLYVAGGCTTVTAQYYCSSNISSDIRLASINADGSITDWTTIAGITGTRMSYGFTAWRNHLYAIGGCTATNSASTTCSSPSSNTYYGSINSDGDVSTVSTSTASGSGTCVSTGWYGCDLPPEGDGNGESGRMSGSAIINNGYIYYMGGCTQVNSNSVCFTGNSGKSTDNISYAQIDSVGHITRISSCSGSFVGSWCVINGTGILGNKLSAFSYAVFNNTLYIIGGTTGTEWQDDVWRTTFNSDGTWGTWSSQTFAAVGLGNAKGYQFAFSRANPGSAGTYPGNLYVLGGCSGVSATDNGLDCTGNLYTEVYKCWIKTDTSIETTGSACTTSGQLQIDSEPGTGGSQGLGVMAGTVYANYVYMIGGQSINEDERGTVMYAKIDNSNNIVAVSGSDWITSANDIDPVRRRGIAFGYNGYLYALAGYNVGAGGSLNDLLYAKIDVTDGSISEFQTSSVTVSARWDLRAALNNGYVYAIGGCTTGAPPASCTAMTGTVQTFQLYNNYSGSPKAYSAGTQFGTDRYGASATVLNGYIYIAGGCTTAATDCTTASTSVQYASIGADGTIGTWNATTGSLPAARAWGQLEAAGGTLYFVGGQTSGSNNGNTEVYYATPSSGNVASWSTASNGLPLGRTKAGGTVWNNRIYIVGGNSGSGSSTNTVYVSPSLSSGGNITSAWSTTSTDFNVARSGLTAIAYANNLYVLGGFNGSSYMSDVQFAKISTSDGSVGSWTYTTSLPSQLSNADGFAANGFMYLFGGKTGATTCNSNTIVAPISANTSVASGNNPTGIGEWYATNIRYTGSRYGPAAVYNQGKAYVLGGQCNGTMITTTNKVQQTTLQSQPQVAKYSRMIDTDTNVFPTKWLLNGVDNSIGAKWQTSYRSAPDAYYTLRHGTFDQGTNGNNVTENSTVYDNCYGTNNGTNTYDNTQYISPPNSMYVAVASGTGAGACQKTFNLTDTIYDRFYMRIDSLSATQPSANTTIWRATRNDNADVIGTIRILSGSGNYGKIQMRDGTIAAYTSTARLTAGTWYRVEVVIRGSYFEMRVYDGANLHGDVYNTDFSSVESVSDTNGIERINMGIVTNVNATWGLRMDEHRDSAAFWPGSAFPQWGQTTNFGDVTLGTLNTFTPKDSQGTNTNYARWYYFNDTISAQQTYGYPEDVTRGPTIADKTLFFTADPSKRLQHGRTFTGGEQQPLDTPKYDY